MVKTPKQTADGTTAEKRRPPDPPKAPSTYCILCQKSYENNKAQEHVHGMLHHRELEHVLGSDLHHECQACKKSSMSLSEYAQHISATQHKSNLNNLILRSVKPVSLQKILGKETYQRIAERNKKLRKARRKATKKERKKMKQQTNQKCTQVPQKMSKQTSRESRSTIQRHSRHMDRKTSQRPWQMEHRGNGNAAINKENRLTSGFRQHPQGQPPKQPSQCEDRGWFHQAYQKFSVNSNMFDKEWSQGAVGYRETDLLDKTPWDAHGSGMDAPHHSLSSDTSQHQEYRYRHHGDAEHQDFLSDQYPKIGMIRFDEKDKSKGPPHAFPGRSPHCPNSTYSASTSKCMGVSKDEPIRDADINAMLWQVRRTLGVREPCRADRAARSQKQSSKTSASEGEHEPERQRTDPGLPCSGSLGHKPSDRTASPRFMSRAVSDPSPKATKRGGFRPAGAGMKQSAGRPQIRCRMDAQKNPKDGESPAGSTLSKAGSLVLPASFNRCMGKTTSAEPNLNAARRIRNVGDSRKAEGDKEAGFKPTLQKLLKSSVCQRKVNWREMYQEVRRKSQEKVKGMPRFGIELTNPPSDRDGPPEDEDLPLSEGFHWESAFPDYPPPALFVPAPPPQDTAADSSMPERQSAPRTEERFEPPAKDLGDGKTMPGVPPVSVKVEPDLEMDEDRHLEGNSGSPIKRKSKGDEDLSNTDPSVKKKKTKSNTDQTQVDQLLAVSLREEELNKSLKDLDGSLIQARNALQAVYTEVQRLLLLRQQFTAEINSLRAKRIEILQGMQDGFSGTSGRVEEEDAPSEVAVTAMSPRPPSPHSSSPYTTSSTLSLAVPSDASTSHASFAQTRNTIKQEVLEQAHQPAKVPPRTSAAPETPSRAVLPMLSSVLLPSLLLPPVSTSCIPEPRADASASSNKPFEQRMRDRCKVRERSVVVKEKNAGAGVLMRGAQLVDGYPKEKPGGHPSLEQVKKKGSATSICAPHKRQEEPVVADVLARGSESDSSVEMMEPSSGSILTIDIDKWDEEGVPEPVSNASISPELVQTSVCTELSSASTQTMKFEDDDSCRKLEFSTISNKVSKIDPDCVTDVEPSLGTFQSHDGPVQGMQVHKGLLYTCSGDHTARAYCLVSRECKAVFLGHTNKVNCLLVSSPPQMPARLYTGSSDQTIRGYSIKSSKCLEQISLPHRVLCLQTAWNILYAGLANGSVVSFDLRTQKQLDVFECHNPRGVSCLDAAQEGARRILLVGSYDGTISVRDAKSGLLLRSLKGHTKTVLCMKRVNDLVFSGSSDTSVYAHNIHTGELVRIYKGHGHAVTSVAILGKVMVTSSLDKLVHVYELQSHDRLQVYGGHNDMVMCMVVYKSVIYTGCYDGSIHAVKLNLMKNCRCWWHGCTLIFGMEEHLLHHLLRDHTNPNLHILKCRWRGCNAYFANKDAVKQELPGHMVSHVEHDSRLEP